MRSRAMSCVVGGVMVGAVWLTGACGSSFSAGAPEGGSGEQSVASAGRSSGGATSGVSGAHSGKAGSGSEPSVGGSGGTEVNTGGGGVPPTQGGSAGLNVAGVAGVGLIVGGASGTGAGGTSGAGAGGTSGAGAGGGGAGGGGAGGAGAAGAGAGGGGAGGTSGAGAGGGGAGGAIGCLASTMTWAGCQAPACGACSAAPEIAAHPLYFKNHPSCTPIASCPNAYTACGAACPAPSDADLCNGTSGQWSGCRGSGCYVCAELVTNYPKYFEHHPGCVKNGTCMGVFATCNANCPAPAAADM